MFANLSLGVLLGHKVTPVISHAIGLLPLSSFSWLRIFYIASIYSFLDRLSLFVSNNKRHDGWTDWTHNLCGTSRNPREGLWMLRISNNCLQKLPIHKKKIFYLRTILFCYILCKELMLNDNATIKSWNRRKPSMFNQKNFLATKKLIILESENNSSQLQPLFLQSKYRKSLQFAVHNKYCRRTKN